MDCGNLLLEETCSFIRLLFFFKKKQKKKRFGQIIKSDEVKSFSSYKYWWESGR